MKKTTLLAILILGCVIGYALDFVPGSGETVLTDQTRDYSFGYNTGADDYHWYGSNQWAVRYNFKAQYPSLSIAQFSVSGASVYFPVIGNPVTVELFSDNAGQPQQRVKQVITTVTQNQMYFDFGTPTQAEVIWLVITYDTTYAGPYVAASIGGGTRSYFLNTNVSSPYFQSMANAGFSCEFLMNVVGDFLLSSNDLELSSLDIGDDLIPNANVLPKFTIYNHSNYTVNSAQIELSVTSPTDAGFSHQATIPVGVPIQPQSQFILDTALSPYQTYQFRLDRDPMQIKARAVLSSEFATTDTLFNNTKTVYRNVFQSPMPMVMAENFLRNSEVLPINALQATPEGADLHKLLYFPILSDSLSGVGAVSRFSWYSLFSTPVTVINGTERISGLTPDYAADFDESVTTAIGTKSFISSGVCSLTFPTTGENLQIRLLLSNSSTYLFNSTAEPNLPASSRLFVAFFKRTEFEDTPLYVFNRWIAFGDTISTNLFYGQTADKQYSTSLSNIDLDDLAQNYRLYYWLQLGSGQILYANFKDLATGMLVDDQLISPIRLSVYPNPSRGQAVTIGYETRSDIAGTDLSLYNLRGQLIWQSTAHTGQKLSPNTVIPGTTFPANGIYILKLSYRDSRGNTSTKTTKITYIK